MGIAIFLVLVLVSSQPTSCQNHSVVKGPEAVTAPLGSNASFTCVVENADLRWVINTNITLSLTAEDLWKEAANPINGFFRGEVRNISSTVTAATLLVSASVHNNGTAFGCAAFGGFDYLLEYSPNAHLTVFGLPLSPGEVEVEGEGEGQLRVVWTPPFSLPGELISYSLLVRDETSGDHTTVGPLSDTNYTHTLSEIQALDCHFYSFSVFSINDVGLSPNSSYSPPALHPSIPGIVIISSSEVLFTDSLTVLLHVKIPDMCSPVNLTVILESVNSVAVHCPVDDSSKLPLTLTTRDCGVKEDEKYTVTVLAENKFKLSSSSEPVTIYTTDVQWASGQELANGSVLLKCGFVRGSTAKGCQLTLYLSQSGRVRIVVQLQKRNASQEATEVYEGPVEWGVGPYLLVADIEEDGDAGGREMEGSVYLIRAATGVSTSTALPATPTLKAGTSNDSKGGAAVVTVMAVVAGIAVVLVLTTISVIIFIRIRNRKTRAVHSQTPSGHIYEDVDLGSRTHHDYLTHKLDTTRDHAPSHEVGVAKPSGGPYAFTVSAGMGSDFDAYEVMKPSDSVKNTLLLTTAENVCYTTHQHLH